MRTALFRESPVIVGSLLLAACALSGTSFHGLPIAGGIALMWFFRVPDRKRPSYDPRAIVSPCDGEVLEVEHVDSRTVRIVVYMSVLDVHIQWYPTHGRVGYLSHIPGEFNLAKLTDKSEHNERMVTRIENEYGSVRVDQIAGQLARRIVNHSVVNKFVKRADEMGMIKLSSRCDVFLSTKDAVVIVKKGDTLTGSQTIIAQWDRKN